MATGAYFRLEDTGLRCITAPCFSLRAELLNVGIAIPLSELDLSSASATREQVNAASEALARGELFAAGRLRVASGPAGLGLGLVASQFYAASPTSACRSHADCPAGSWCRVTEDGAYFCVPFAREGEPCSGSAAPWEYQECSPELYCDVPELPATPGVCRARCDVCEP